MPPPLKVRLLPHDPKWAEAAAAEALRIREAVAPLELRIHHIGSTAIPGLAAKAILDLLAVAPSLEALDRMRPDLESLGYSWHGELGLAGRRYCKLDDPGTGERCVQLHGYAAADPGVRRHLAFRDLLRERPALAAAYQHEKMRCAALHPDDSHAYADCKSNWIRRVEDEAMSLTGPNDAFAD